MSAFVQERLGRILEVVNVASQPGRALFGLSPAELRELMVSLGEKPYRATQRAAAL